MATSLQTRLWIMTIKPSQLLRMYVWRTSKRSNDGQCHSQLQILSFKEINARELHQTSLTPLRSALAINPVATHTLTLKIALMANQAGKIEVSRVVSFRRINEF
ncbi:hypothetical protein [Pantoea sp. App145]|uniref:hypothetical protein n=1 Tax=Pantoea sp. App145 TaxID=3071567 RepID=UPI003A8078E7